MGEWGYGRLFTTNINFGTKPGEELLILNSETIDAEDPRISEYAKSLLKSDPKRTLIQFNGFPKFKRLHDGYLFVLVGCIINSENNKTEAVILSERLRMGNVPQSVKRGDFSVKELVKCQAGYQGGKGFREVDGQAYYMWEEEDVYNFEEGTWKWKVTLFVQKVVMALLYLFTFGSL